MDPVENICYCAVRSVISLNCKIIICITETGATASIIRKFNPPCLILGLTNNWHVVRQMKLIRSVFPVFMNSKGNEKSFVERSMNIAK